MLEHRYFPIDGIKVEKITVDRCQPDYNALEWQTFTLITEGLDVENPGEDEEIARYFRMLMCKGRVFRPGTVYANPCGVVRSPRADALFFQVARQIQRDWFRQLNNGLHSAQRVQRAMRTEEPLIKQMKYTGVLFIDSRHVFPDQWPDIRVDASPEQRIRPGQRFGKLVVLETLPRGEVRCRCDCGTEAIKKRKQFVSEPTKSCGCSPVEHQERQRNRRRNRGWKHTGDLGS